METIGESIGLKVWEERPSQPLADFGPYRGGNCILKH